MKKIKRNIVLTLLIVILLSVTNINAKEYMSNEWNKLLGGSSYDALLKVIASKDNNLIAVGGTTNGSDGNINENAFGTTDALITKYNKAGEKIWAKVYGNTESDFFNSVVETKSGNIVAVGSSNSNIAGVTNKNGDAIVVVFDKNGNVLKEMLFGGTGQDSFTDIKELPSGDLIAVGQTRSSANGQISSSNHGAADGLVVSFDSALNKQWDMQYGGLGIESFKAVAFDSANNIVAVGDSTSGVDGNKTVPSFGSEDGVVVKVDSTNGNIIWDKAIGTDKQDVIRNLAIDNDDNIIIVGSSGLSTVVGNITESYFGIDDAFVFKMDSNGNKIFSNLYGVANGVTGFTDVVLSNNKIAVSGYIISSNAATGNVSPNKYGITDAIIIEMDNSGVPTLDYVFGGSKSDYLDSMVESDGYYYAVGSTDSSNNGLVSDESFGGNDGLLVKLFSNNPPKITADSEKSITVNSDVKLVDLFNVLAQDKEEGNITSKVVIDDSGVNYALPGTYTVTFSITDNKGDKDEVSVKLIITEEVKNDNTQQDKEDTEKEETDDSKSDVPKTGQDSSLIILTITTLISLIGLKVCVKKYHIG